MARLLWATGVPFPSRGGSQVGGCAVVEVRRNWREIVDLVQCRRAKLWGRCGAEGKWERCPSRPDCTQLSANGCRCQPARRGESQGRGWLSDLQIYNFRGVGGVDHAPSGRGWRMARMKGMRIRRDADADHAVGVGINSGYASDVDSQQQASTCVRRCRLDADLQMTRDMNSEVFLFQRPRRAICPASPPLPDSLFCLS